MKLTFFVLLAIISASSVFAQNSNSIEGKWQTGVDNTVIETYEKDGAWYGKIISSDNPKASIGFDILRDFKVEGDSWKGQIYAVKKGKLLDAEINPAKDKLMIKVSSGLFSKDLEWPEVQD